MNTAFDTIVGPDGVWTESESPSSAAEPSLKLNEREEFALRCLNAAVNLYGVIGVDDFVGLYNGYAKDHEAPVSDEMTLEEVDDLVDRLQKFRETAEEHPDCFLDTPDVWFEIWTFGAGTPRLLVYDGLLNDDDCFDGTPRTQEEQSARQAEVRADISRRIADTVKKFCKASLKLLPESLFLEYEEPMWAEATENTESLVRFIASEYGIDEDEADLCVGDILSNARVNGATVQGALDYVRDMYVWAPTSLFACQRLVDSLVPALRDVRTWEGRGRTRSELAQLGLCERSEAEDDADLFEAMGEDDVQGGSLADDDGDTFTASDVPASSYSGPIDFKFVKDPQRRAEKLDVYDVVRQVTGEYVRDILQPEMTDSVLRHAAVRLGCLKKREKLSALAPPADGIVRYFALMLDDQDGVPLRCRAMSRSETFDAFERKAATYFENFRYTWLKILAYKAGVGCRCHDLLTGEELFLVEPTMTDGDVKGRTVCCGIAPMGDVYLALGVLFVARFEDPETQLKDLLKRLEIADEFPIRLGPADQARLAVETIRGFRELGYVFDMIVHK